MKGLILLTMILMLAGASPSHAVPIFDNGGPLTGGGDDFISDLDWPGQIADDFSLEAGLNVIGDIHWWGVYAFAETPGVDDFTIEIYSNVSNAPGATLVSLDLGSANRMDSGIDQTDGHDIYKFWVNTSPIALDPGTYWLSIFNDTSADLDDDWYWSKSALTGNSMWSTNGGASWTIAGSEQAFNLTPIPEPATMLLLGSGLVGLAGLSRKKFRK
jgi:hypothetical protein